MSGYISLRKFLVYNSILCIFLFITSCGLYREAPTSDIPVNDRDKRQKNIEEGRGITVFKGDTNDGNFNFASSNPMWRATLNILDFTPLSNVDYGGGIIITDWYSSDEKNSESLKISVQFLANEIRADGLEVNIFKKNCNQNQNCKVSKINNELNQEVKLAILKQAAKIEKGDKKKDLEDSGRKIIIPK